LSNKQAMIWKKT